MGYTQQQNGQQHGCDGIWKIPLDHEAAGRIGEGMQWYTSWI